MSTTVYKEIVRVFNCKNIDYYIMKHSQVLMKSPYNTFNSDNLAELCWINKEFKV